MGLTLHYKLTAPALPAEEIRDVIERLHDHALELPFGKVLNVMELKGESCQFKREEQSDRYAWLKIQTTRLETQEKDDIIHSTNECHPSHIIAFTVHPAKGSEAANFGLCRYPDEKGWSWSSFCKTQYASDPSAGDVGNFLKCHISLVCLLDKARAMEILGEVMDEGGYWENRDVAALAREVAKWNQTMAGFYGQIRDVTEAAGTDPRQIVAAIAKFQNFEKLEAEGRRGELRNNG